MTANETQIQFDLLPTTAAETERFLVRKRKWTIGGVQRGAYSVGTGKRVQGRVWREQGRGVAQGRAGLGGVPGQRGRAKGAANSRRMVRNWKSS